MTLDRSRQQADNSPERVLTSLGAPVIWESLRASSSPMRMPACPVGAASRLMVWSVCIFAHNEERLLPQCLKALDAAAAGGEYVVHIMENGSSDQTASVARAFAAADPRINAHHLSLGDKSNAWNEYVHRVAGDAEMHVFIDGDVRPSANSFKALNEAFQASPQSYAAAALPATGRSRKSWAARLFLNSYLSGNLYAVRGTAARLIRERNIRLPIGSVGEDGILSYLMLTDLKGGRDDSHKERIAVATDAFFEFDSLQINARDLQIYRRRLRRYSRRYFQTQKFSTRCSRKAASAQCRKRSSPSTRRNRSPAFARALIRSIISWIARCSSACARKQRAAPAHDNRLQSLSVFCKASSKRLAKARCESRPVISARALLRRRSA